MKTNLLSLLVLATMVTVAPLQTKASGTPVQISQQTFLSQTFGYFRVHRISDDASLNWSVTDPQAVISFTIERSYDGMYFETIDEVASTGLVTYKYRDNTVFPGTIYYRITAHQAGYSVTSAIESLRIVKRG